MIRKCVVLVTNKNFLSKAFNTISQIISSGKYNDDMVLIIGNDLKKENFNLNYDKLTIKHFDDINRSAIVNLLNSKPINYKQVINKTFQWHKIHCYDSFFKQWDVVLYVDSGMFVYNNINVFFELDWKDSLLAHSDAYPNFTNKLNCQFEKKYFPEIYNRLNENYDIHVDYFQTGVMVYDTRIIQCDTKQKLIDLSNDYYNSKTNEQAIMNLYFNCCIKVWKPLPITYNNQLLYDYCNRNKDSPSQYTMLKYPKHYKIRSFKYDL